MSHSPQARPTPPHPTGARADAPWRNAAALASCVLVAIVLLGAIERLTAEQIEAARAAKLDETLATVLPATVFDNDPANDRRWVRAAALGRDDPSLIYRARLGGQGVGAVLSVVAPDGYNGAIELLVGIGIGIGDGDGDGDGDRIGRVRVVAHRETPGLGDRIERERSDWIAQFDARTAEPDDSRTWSVVRGEPNGDDEFDALTGATITSRAVVEAVDRALRWFAANRVTVFSG